MDTGYFKTSWLISRWIISKIILCLIQDSKETRSIETYQNIKQILKIIIYIEVHCKHLLNQWASSFS